MELHFTRENGPVDDIIDSLMELAEGIQYPEVIREIILAALKAGQEEREKTYLRLMNSTLKEMRFTSKVFGPYRNVKKVSVFGSARVQPGLPIYNMASLFGRKLAAKGYMVITGGGPGIMQAVNEGAGPQNSFGVNIQLPFEQETNHILKGNPRLIFFKYFFNRKVAFIKEADAVALFPGGFGTFDEAMEAITLVQTGKCEPMPLILLDQKKSSYWPTWLNFLKKELLPRGYINASDFDLFEQVNSVSDAVNIIDRFYSRYHSIRYIGDLLVIRITSAIDHIKIKKLKNSFSDILTPNGDLRLSGALPEEIDEPEIAHLPRIVIDFKRKNFGRLRNLIDAINNL